MDSEELYRKLTHELDLLQDQLDTIPDDSHQLECSELVRRLERTLARATTCATLENRLLDDELRDAEQRISRDGAA